MKTWQKSVMLAALAGLCAAPALAERGVPVTERPRPDYDPPRIRIGGLQLMPEMKMGVEYNDNIYAEGDNREADTITTAKPRLQIRSDWSRHALGLDTGAAVGMFASATDENYLDAHLTIDGRLDILRGTNITASLDWQKLHEERGEPDADGAWKNPAEYYQGNAHLQFTRSSGKLTVSSGGHLTVLDYHSVDLLAGGTENLDLRDRTHSTVDGKLAYLLHPGVDSFVSASYHWRRYDLSEAARDSEGYRLGIGSSFDLGGVTSGEIFAGYMRQDYDFRESIDGLWFGGNLLWNVTQLTSVQAEVRSSVKETTQSDSSGINAIDGNLRVDHELRRNLLVGGFVGYTHDDYQSVEITEEYLRLGSRLTYLINRNFRAELLYSHNDKSSSQVDREYRENRVTLSIAGSL